MTLPVRIESLESRTLLAAELLADINPVSDGTSNAHSIVLNDTLYFGWGSDLWKSDGTSGGHRPGETTSPGTRRVVRATPRRFQCRAAPVYGSRRAAHGGGLPQRRHATRHLPARGQPPGGGPLLRRRPPRVLVLRRRGVVGNGRDRGGHREDRRRAGAGSRGGLGRRAVLPHARRRADVVVEERRHRRRHVRGCRRLAEQPGDAYAGRYQRPGLFFQLATGTLDGYPFTPCSPATARRRGQNPWHSAVAPAASSVWVARPFSATPTRPCPATALGERRPGGTTRLKDVIPGTTGSNPSNSRSSATPSTSPRPATPATRRF